jgi:hypothetical protein
MEIFGELERVFATSLYPLRIPIAIGLAIIAVVLVAIARRRGWFATARRHPGRSAILIVAVLAIALPSAYYLGSPLFIRTALVEPDPIAEVRASPTVQPPDATSTPTLPGGSVGTSTASPSEPESTPAPTPFVPGPVASGSFTGADDFHFGSGTASIVETAPGAYTLRFTDFSVRNGPDLFVYLSADASGYTAGALELGKLKATDGSFGYALPPGTDPTTFASAVIWCKQFSVQFAVAPLAAR